LSIQGGFATSYDASLEPQKRPTDFGIGISNPSGTAALSHNERAVDVSPPGLRIGASGDAGVHASGGVTTPTSPSSPSGEAKGPKFGLHVKIGKSKDKKPRPRIEDGLKSSLATAGMAGGSVQISQGLNESASARPLESRSLSREDKRKSSSNV